MGMFLLLCGGTRSRYDAEPQHAGRAKHGTNPWSPFRLFLPLAQTVLRQLLGSTTHFLFSYLGQVRFTKRHEADWLSHDHMTVMRRETRLIKGVARTTPVLRSPVYIPSTTCGTHSYGKASQYAKEGKLFTLVVLVTFS